MCGVCRWGAGVVGSPLHGVRNLCPGPRTHNGRIGAEVSRDFTLLSLAKKPAKATLENGFSFLHRWKFPCEF